MICRLSDEYFVRALRASDLDGPYPGWFEDLEVCRYNSHGVFCRTRAWFEAYFRDLDRNDRVVWAVCHSVDGHIGNISLQSISWIDRRAEFAILMGDKRHWGKGVSILAGRRLLEHGFTRLNLERVYCGTAATNTAMRKLAAKLGMAEEGCRRKHVYLEGSWVDVVDYGVLRDEFLGMPGPKTT
jgi:[ribosomal protein S5]-alanine N-acetyltransferase